MTRLPIGRPRFVTLEEALGWHDTAIAQYGGSLGVRDMGLLESALAQPRQQFGGEFAHEYPFGMGAAYAYFVAKNHPFVDGNKRVALFCAGGFLRMNGWNLESKGEEAADAILALVEGQSDRDACASWLKAHSRPRPSMELRDFFGLVDPDQHYEHLSAVTAPASPVEYRTSLDEATASIPLLAHLQARMKACEESGKTTEASAFAGHILMLLAIHRIAEDMGYEW